MSTVVDFPAPPGDIRYEVVGGEIRELPPMGAHECWIAAVLDQYLGPFARANRLGRVAPEMLFRLGPNLPQRRPDLAFVSYQRWPQNQPIPFRVNAWDVVPDLTVEVVSPSDDAVDLLDRVSEYFTAGVRQVWVVYPTQRVVHVFDSLTQIRVVTIADDLTGDPVLPGFRMPLATLFEDAGPAP